MENIDLAREMRARLYRECRERGQFSSRDKAASAFSVENVKISASSLKDFETGKRTPSPNLVLDMARVYQTPELKWLHCSTVCPIGLEIYKKGAGLGTEDIYRTYFELAGAFDRINDVVTSLHEIIADDAFTPDEEEKMDEILGVLDKITESTDRLRVWIEKSRKGAR